MDFSTFGLNLSEYFTPTNISMIIRIVAWIVIGLPLVILLSKWIRKYSEEKLSPQQGMVLGKLIKYTGIIIIAISLLNELGFKLVHLLGAAGIVGIAIGFASQTSASNIISGFFLIAEKPFEINDLIKIGDTTGQVLAIDMLSVKLRTFDNRFVRIPNETIVKSEVINVTRFPIRRVDLNVGVAYKEDIGRVRDILLNLARTNPLCLNEPEPLVLLTGYGNSSIDLLLAVWAFKEDWMKLKNSMLEEVKKRFDQEGIEIPFPHVSIYSGTVTQPIPIQILKQSADESDSSV